MKNTFIMKIYLMPIFIIVLTFVSYISSHGHHDSMLCQYDIHKAINAIEKFQLFKFPGLKSTSPESLAGTE